MRAATQVVCVDDPPANLRGTVTVTAAAADAGSGVAQVQFQVSPTGANAWLPLGITGATPYSVELDTTTLTDGLYDFRTVALDVSLLSLVGVLVAYLIARSLF